MPFRRPQSVILRTLSLLLLATLACMPAIAKPRPQQQLKPKDLISSLEDQWRTATLASDPVALDKLLSDDYVGISWNGQVNTKTMQLDHLRNHTLVFTQIDVTDRKIKVVGSVAIVTATADITGKNETSDLHGTYRYTRVYQRLPTGSWKITNFESTRVPIPGQHGMFRKN